MSLHSTSPDAAVDVPAAAALDVRGVEEVLRRLGFFSPYFKSDAAVATQGGDPAGAPGGDGGGSGDEMRTTFTTMSARNAQARAKAQVPSSFSPHFSRTQLMA